MAHRGLHAMVLQGLTSERILVSETDHMGLPHWRRPRGVLPPLFRVYHTHAKLFGRDDGGEEVSSSANDSISQSALLSVVACEQACYVLPATGSLPA